MKLPLGKWLEEDDELHEEPLRARILEAIVDQYKAKEDYAGAQVMRHFEKAVTLQILDQCWKEHLASMDYLRQGIGLRGYAQKNPKQEYKREAFEMFQALTGRIKSEVVGLLSKVQVRAEEDVEAVEARRRRSAPVEAIHAAPPEPADTSRAFARIGAGGRGGGGAGDGAHAGRGRRRHGAPAADASPGLLRVTPHPCRGGRRRTAAFRPGGPLPIRARRTQDRPKRALSMRLGQEVQAMLRPAEVRSAFRCP